MESFEDLKVGDEVAICSPYEPTISRVTRTTRTQIEVGYGKYRRKDGFAVGCRSGRLLRLTPQLRASIEEREYPNQASQKLRHVRWQRLTIDQLRAVLSLVESFDARATGDEA